MSWLRKKKRCSERKTTVPTTFAPRYRESARGIKRATSNNNRRYATARAHLKKEERENKSGERSVGRGSEREFSDGRSLARYAQKRWAYVTPKKRTTPLIGLSGLYTETHKLKVRPN